MPNPLDHLPGQAFRALNAAVRPLVKLGLGSPPPVGVGATVLGTTGRRTGLAREVPLAGMRLGDRMVVSTVRDRSHWVRNLEAEPRADVWIAGRRRAVTANVQHLPGLTVAFLRLD